MAAYNYVNFYGLNGPPAQPAYSPLSSAYPPPETADVPGSAPSSGGGQSLAAALGSPGSANSPGSRAAMLAYTLKNWPEYGRPKSFAEAAVQGLGRGLQGFTAGQLVKAQQQEKTDHAQKLALALAPDDPAKQAQIAGLIGSGTVDEGAFSPMLASSLFPEAAKPLVLHKGDAVVSRQADGSYKPLYQPPAGAAGYRPATAEEKAAFGVDAAAPLVIGPDNKPQMLGGKSASQTTWRPATLDEKKAYGVEDGTPLMIASNGDTRVAGGSMAAPVNSEDVDSIAAAIINGDQPPDVKGLYKLGGPVRAALERKGYNYSAASQDWEATKRLLATMNGPTQTRLRQAVGQVKETLPLLRQLAEKWQASGFPVLNAANRVAAETGAYGPEAQKIIANLKSAVADVTGEMGNVLMGGNAPTDHALELAAQNLSADWSHDTFLSGLDQMQKLLTYRENALKLGTAGVAESRYNQMNPTSAINPPAAAPAGGGAPDPMGIR